MLALSRAEERRPAGMLVWLARDCMAPEWKGKNITDMFVYVYKD